MADEEPKPQPQLPSMQVAEAARDERGQLKKGSTANPGGLSKEARAARDLLRDALAGPTFIEAFKKGYLKQLKAANPFVLKDFADRVGGKAKDLLEIKDTTPKPLDGVPAADLLAFIKANSIKK